MDIKKTITKFISKINFKKICIVGGILILLGCLILLGTNLYVYYSTKNSIISVEDANDMNADCIIVLGAGVKDDKPTWMLEDRIITGVKLYENSAAPKIIMSGDHGREDYDEVNIMKDYAINQNVPSEDIFMDHAGFSTYETMYRAKEVFGAKKVVIASQGYHLYRSIYIAKKLGLEAYGVDATLRDYPSKKMYREVREVLARTKDFFKLIVKPTPTYLGDPIDLKASGDITNDK